MIWTGFLVGLLFGFVLERGYFCQYGGFMDWILFRRKTILKGTIWAILVAMIGFHLLASLGAITLNPKPFFWLASLIGGLIFGLGMTLAGGCAGGTTFKIGTGLISYLVAGLGIAIGGYLAALGALKSYIQGLQIASRVTIDGVNPTLASLFRIDPWLIVGVLAILLIWLLLRMREKGEIKEKPSSLFEKLLKRRWTPALTGFLIGIVGMIAFITSSATDRKYPLGIVEGYIPILKSFLTGNFGVINWMYLLIPGIILGSAIAALLAGEWRLRLPKLKQVAIMFISGILMGIGAVTGVGCNVTHILSGLPQLSLASLFSTLVIFTPPLIYSCFIRPK